MCKRVKASLPYLQVLWTTKPCLQKVNIDQARNNVIDAICECSLNVVKGVTPLAPRQKRCLPPYKTQLRALAKKKISQKQKRFPQPKR